MLRNNNFREKHLGRTARAFGWGFELEILPTDFDAKMIRRVYDKDTQTRWFSVIDVVKLLTQQADDLSTRKY